jgi:capsid protein
MPRPIILDSRGRPAVRAGYDATDSGKEKRRAPRSTIRFEDVEANSSQRKQLQATVADQRRNFAIIQWMIDSHLDYVASFRFQSRAKDRGFGKAMEERMHDWSLARNCHLARRHGLGKLVRLVEALRVVDGDCLVNRTAEGRLQIIEGNRIASPSYAMTEGWPANVVHGVEYDPVTMEALRYAVCTRRNLGDMLEFAGWVPAKFADMPGYYWREDQIRGISPLASAINTAQDLYETLDFTTQKTKLHALLGVFFKRAAVADMGGDLATQDADTGDTPTGDTGAYKVPVKGLLKIEGEPGDDVEMLESRTPSSEFQSFTESLVRIVMSALGIPYSFYDPRGVSYSAGRLDLIRYQLAVDQKREDLVGVLNNIARWKFAYWVRSGALTLPRGMTFADVRWDWVPASLAWIDPLAERQGAVLGCATAMDSPIAITRAAGGDIFDHIDDMAEVQKYAATRGVTLAYSLAPNLMTGAMSPQQQRTQEGQ